MGHLGHSRDSAGSPARRVAMWLMGAALLLAPTSALAQDAATIWPERPVRFVVPFPAGSATDIVARIIAQKLTTQLGHQFVVDNRSGASGDIGTTAVVRADPDGYTMGLATASTHAVSASLNPNLSYNTVTDFAPISMIGYSPYVLAVYPGVPAKNVAELIALAKSKPKELSFASAGPASLAHVAGVLFQHLAGVQLNAVPYRSSGQSVNDIIEGRIEIQFGTLGPTLGQLRDGKLRALAITGPTRISSMPDVPTLQEAGLAGYDVVLWMAVVMPAGTPPVIVAKLNGAMRDALSSPDIVAALKTQEMEPEATSPEELRERIRSEIAKWKSILVSTETKK
jgi:tripartite-type tricarboxylate transporter receptor subunit TctC